MSDSDRVKRCERCEAEEGGYHNPGCIHMPKNEELKKKILNLFDGYIESFACCTVDREELADKLLALVEREKDKSCEIGYDQGVIQGAKKRPC